MALGTYVGWTSEVVAFLGGMSLRSVDMPKRALGSTQGSHAHALGARAWHAVETTSENSTCGPISLIRQG